MKWTPKDQAIASSQGWLPFSADFVGKTVVVIQRLDESNRFPDDSAAAAYVVGRAEMGCPVARKALKLIDAAYRSIGSLKDPNILVA